MAALLNKHLSDKELDKLSATLSGFSNDKAMSLEEVDGFFAAFHCSPNMVSLNDFLSEVWGDEIGEEDAPFENPEELSDFLNLLMRYWNDVGRRFETEVFLPNLAVDEKTNEAKGNEWAKGFLRGANIAGGFEEIIEDEKKGGSFLPIFALAHEHDKDPELKSFQKELTSKQREELLIMLCAGVTRIYRYFLSHRKAYAKTAREKNIVRNPRNVPGRNEPCYCGSGVKYKKCCLH